MLSQIHIKISLRVTKFVKSSIYIGLDSVAPRGGGVTEVTKIYVVNVSLYLPFHYPVQN